MRSWQATTSGKTCSPASAGPRTAGSSASFTIISARSAPRSNPCWLEFRRWSASRTNRSPTEEAAGLEISQDREAGGCRRQVLEGVSAQQISGRVNCPIGELKHLSERIEHPREDPIMCTAVLRRAHQEQQNHCETGKKLNPEVEPQIIAPAPQQQAEQADRERRPQQQDGSGACAHALLD